MLRTCITSSPPHPVLAAVKVDAEVAHSLKLVASEVWGSPDCDIHQGSGVDLERVLGREGGGGGGGGDGEEERRRQGGKEMRRQGDEKARR